VKSGEKHLCSVMSLFLISFVNYIQQYNIAENVMETLCSKICIETWYQVVFGLTIQDSFQR